MRIYWDGKSKNIIGEKIKYFRRAQGLTQKQLAEKLQLRGHEFSDLTILRIENKTRFVADHELKALAQVLKVGYGTLLD